MKCATFLLLWVVTVVWGASVQTDGESLVSPNLIGGEREEFQDVPYAIKLKLVTGDIGGPTRHCGAVRLDRYWFLTTAECLDSHKYEFVYINYPILDGYTKFKTERLNIEINTPIIHPKYNNITKANNIGVINCNYWCDDIADHKLLPVLPKRGETFSSTKPIVTGWTITNATAEEQDFDGITSYETTIVNSFLCKLVYFFRSVTSEHICASTWGGKRVTEAHAGVPLVVREEGSTLKLIGIASSVQPWTAKLPVPTVFTNIAQHAEWISQVTGIPIKN